MATSHLQAVHHPRSKRLIILLNLAEKDVNHALQNWGQFQQRYKQEQDQYQQLNQYYDEYQAQLATPSTQHVSSSELHNHLYFIEQINHSLEQQKTRLTELEYQTQEARNEYLNKKNKMELLVSLIEKLEKEYSQEVNKKEQRESDDWSIQMLRRS